MIETVTEIICQTVDKITKASNKNSAWVTVRTSLPTHLFDIPRWHVDGHYYGPFPYPGIVFKFAATLKGPSTLLYRLPDDMREIFYSHMDNQLLLENRLFLSELLDINKAESPQKGQGVLFIVDNDQLGAVHSEPKIHENRLFFSILPGDESEINELSLRWHTQ